MLLQIIEMQASMHQCTAVVDFLLDKMRPYPVTVNDEHMYTHAKSVGDHLLGETNFAGLHTPHLIIDEDVLPIGAALHAAIATTYLNVHVGKH